MNGVLQRLLSDCLVLLMDSLYPLTDSLHSLIDSLHSLIDSLYPLTDSSLSPHNHPQPPNDSTHPYEQTPWREPGSWKKNTPAKTNDTSLDPTCIPREYTDWAPVAALSTPHAAEGQSKSDSRESNVSPQKRTAQTRSGRSRRGSVYTSVREWERTTPAPSLQTRTEPEACNSTKSVPK